MEYNYEKSSNIDNYATPKKNNGDISKLESFPVKMPHHSLLLNHDWVFNNIELLLNNYEYYRDFQGFDEYYFFFKVITEKYPIDNYYNDILLNDEKDTYLLRKKLDIFSHSLTTFFSFAPDSVLKALLENLDFISYFLKYPIIYNASVIENLGVLGIEKFLEYDNISSYYINNPNKLIDLIEEKQNIKIPKSIIENKNVIKYIARTINIEKFYYNLNLLSKHGCITPYIEEHKKFCDTQIESIENGILPCLKSEFDKKEPIIKKEKIQSSKDSLKKQVAIQIFKKYKSNSLPKELFYQELSKYYVIGMFISRYYETAPYNLLIDIETLYHFSKEHNRFLLGNSIYEILCNFESSDVFEIVTFYKKVKNLPLMELLYDDWNNQKNSLVQEINDNLMNFDTLLPLKSDNGITYYDITDVGGIILVHNTSIPIDDLNKLKNMLIQLKNGNNRPFCLSVQDKNHQKFYKKDYTNDSKTFKLAFGSLESDRVGITYHKDADSTGITTVNPKNFEYIRKLYTLDDFMTKTYNHNEITYTIDHKSFLPIGIICEDEITEEEFKVSQFLNIPIIFRKKKKYENKTESNTKTLIKYYVRSISGTYKLFN